MPRIVTRRANTTVHLEEVVARLILNNELLCFYGISLLHVY